MNRLMSLLWRNTRSWFGGGTVVLSEKEVVLRILRRDRGLKVLVRILVMGALRVEA